MNNLCSPFGQMSEYLIERNFLTFPFQKEEKFENFLMNQFWLVLFAPKHPKKQ